jgi:thiol-disulfide isomerase/thioredoxin
MLFTTLAAVALFAPPANAAPTAVSTAPTSIAVLADEHGKVPWFAGTYEEALAKAKAEKKLVFVDFWTTWCVFCKKLDKETYTDDAAVASLKDLICLSIDAESKTGEPIAKKFTIPGFPTLFVLEADGTVRDAIVGFRNPADFKAEIERISADRDTPGDLRRRVTKEPKSIEARHKLAKKLMETGDQKGFDEQMDEIQKLDPESKSLPMRERMFNDVMQKLNDLYGQQKIDEMATTLNDFLVKETYPEVLFSGQIALSQIHEMLADAAEKDGKAEDVKKHGVESRKFLVSAWKNCAEDKRIDFGSHIAGAFWQKKSDLSADEKTFALDVAKKIAPQAEKDKNAAALDAVACAYFLNDKKDDAIKTVRLCMELDPKNKSYAERLKEFGG